MANKASDNLHRLIRSMSKPEKRYFKVFSSRHIIGDENNYEVLFDAIDRQEEYDEEKLLKKFSNKPFAKRFSIAKNRLYNAILKSLDSFHSNSSIEAQLHRQIHAAEILYQKSLYDQSLKLLEGARKVAREHEMLTILTEIAQWEKKIIEKNQYEDIRDEQELETILQEDRNTARALTDLSELWGIKSRLFLLLYRQGKVRNEEEVKAFKSIIDAAAERLSGKETASEAAYLVNHIYSAYFFGLGDYESSFPYLNANISLLESRPHVFNAEPGTYLSVITNAIYVAIRIGKRKEAYRLMDKLSEYSAQPIFANNEDLQIRLFAIHRSTELTLYTQGGDFEKGLSLIPEIAEGLEKFGDKISAIRKAHMYFNIAILCFGVEKYHESLKWINRLLNDVSIDKTRDIHCMAQIMNLVLHIELKNEGLLPYSLRSTQRFLETRKKAHRFESIMLDFINELLKKRQGKSRDDLFRDLAVALEELRKDPYERSAFEFFDFHAWARSRAEGKSYRDLLAA